MKKQVKKSTKKIVRKKTTKKVVRKKAQIKRVKKADKPSWNLFRTTFEDGSQHFFHFRSDLSQGKDEESFRYHIMYHGSNGRRHNDLCRRMVSESSVVEIVAKGSHRNIIDVQEQLMLEAAHKGLLVNRRALPFKVKEYMISTGQIQGKNSRVTDPNVPLGRLISTDSGKVFSGLFPDEASARGHYKLTNSWYKFEYVNPHQFPKEKIYYSVKNKITSLQDKINSTKVAIANRRKGSNPYSI